LLRSLPRQTFQHLRQLLQVQAGRFVFVFLVLISETIQVVPAMTGSGGWRISILPSFPQACEYCRISFGRHPIFSQVYNVMSCSSFKFGD
jgi:hypothetical protein